VTAPVPTQSPEEQLRRLGLRLERERAARKQAEALLEQKSLDLFRTNQMLQETAQGLESRVAQRTAELNDAVREAQAANEAKSRFLALMSHEIRTPMSGVLGLSELLKATALDERQTLYVNNILDAGSSLLALINSILDFSKIEAGEMTLESTWFDPAKLLQETVDLLRAQADRKGVELIVEHAPSTPPECESDPTRLRQIWLNLIGNAIKFTERGVVTVAQYPKDGGLYCTVQDTGIGMSEATLSHLFEPFRQADSSIVRKYGGTGLGLVICKALVEKLGGQLLVTSVVGRGSKFAFDIPLVVRNANTVAVPVAMAHAPPVPELSAQSNSATAADFSQLRILLVDDQPINRLLARNQLKQLGCLPLHEAENGVRALEFLRHADYDVVLMDMQMPEMDGLEATRRLRAMPLGSQPIVIAMTANAFAEDREACMSAGMNQFLSKPVKLETLQEALSIALSQLPGLVRVG
jgi:signal transduction histidine kinase/ActR/RegA family two-component response regulator